MFPAIVSAGSFDWSRTGPPGDLHVTQIASDGFSIWASTDGSGVFGSVDSGVTWTTLNGGLGNLRVLSLATSSTGPPNPTGCPPPCTGPATVYAGTMGGGVFRLDSGASTWIPASVGLSDPIVLTLSADPSTQVIYAGTISGRVFGSFVNLGAPLSWFSVGQIPGDYPVRALTVVPAVPTQILAGTDQGIFRTTDSHTWALVHRDFLQSVSSLATGAEQGMVYAGSVVSSPSDPSLPTGTHGSVLKSTDGGLTWSTVATSLPAVLCLSSAADASLYAGTANGVYNTKDGGVTWAAVGPAVTSVTALLTTFPIGAPILKVFAGTPTTGILERDFARTNCHSDPDTLCLNDGRFSVAVNFDASTIRFSGLAHSMPLTPDTGAFWFFQPSNLELVIKVLDGRAINGHFWVFYGALTNVGYTITVADTTTGAVQTYTNPEGQLASRADTEAF
jgi:hypothetical protein